jgi:hypothetical protein
MPEAAPHVARNALITTIIAIIVSPLSLVLGYYLNHRLASPRLSLEYISDTYVTENHVLDSAVLDALNHETDVIARLRDELMRLTTSANESPCVGWIDAGLWEDRCIGFVTDAANGVSASLRAAVDAPAIPPFPQLRPEEARRKLKALQRLLDDLKNMSDHPDTPRTGDISFTVGVINKGDSDGFVRNRAKLKFGQQELWLYSEKYTVIKGHSFDEIDLHIGESDQNEAAISEFRSAVKNARTDEYKIILDSGEGAIEKAGHLR